MLCQITSSGIVWIGLLRCMRIKICTHRLLQLIYGVFFTYQYILQCCIVPSLQMPQAAGVPWSKTYTVKPVYKDHPRDQQNVVLIHRWSLYADSIAWKVYPWGPVKCGLYKQVVFIYRWSLEQVWLYREARFVLGPHYFCTSYTVFPNSAQPWAVNEANDIRSLF